MKMNLYSSGGARRLAAFEKPKLRQMVTPRHQLAELAQGPIRRERDLLDVLNRLTAWKPRGRHQEEQKRRIQKILRENRISLGFSANALINLAKRLPKDLPKVPSPEPEPPPEAMFEKGFPDFRELRRRADEIADTEPKPVTLRR